MIGDYMPYRGNLKREISDISIPLFNKRFKFRWQLRTSKQLLPCNFDYFIDEGKVLVRVNIPWEVDITKQI
ncbi:hypothetical protein A3746_33670 [Oleibacter sp. HI0075]|nr:hypothetical protein A3746_33670 [Oleibacter sp. HI0075]